MHNEATPQTTLELTLRPMEERDIPAVVAFFAECAQLEPVVEAVTESEFREWFFSPLNTEKFVLAFARNEDGTEGKLIGELEYNLRPGTNRIWGGLHVHPRYRLRGVGRALFNEYERIAAERGATEVRLNPHKDANLLIEFAERRGFEFERYFWILRLPPEKSVAEETLPEGFTARTFVPDQDEELLLHVRNVTFADHYGSVPRTLEEIIYVTRENSFSPEGLFFAFEGDKIAGFCLTLIRKEECERLGYGVGHVQLVGTMPEYRGRGVGRALLIMGVNYLRRSVPFVELGVEGKNADALHLYKSVGFTEYKGWVNMTRPGPHAEEE